MHRQFLEAVLARLQSLDRQLASLGSRDDAGFAERCGDALRNVRVPRDFELGEFLATAAMCALPDQGPSRTLSDHCTKLHDGSTINAYLFLWAESFTNIHDHAAPGAFMVLSGASMQSRFGFQPASPIVGVGQDFYGDLAHIGSELLLQHDVQVVHRGASVTHSLFHLAGTTVTLVVFGKHGRTQTHGFYAPGVCIDETTAGEDEVAWLAEHLRRVKRLSLEAACGLLGYLAQSLTEPKLIRVLIDALTRGIFDGGESEELVRALQSHCDPKVVQMVRSQQAERAFTRLRLRARNASELLAIAIMLRKLPRASWQPMVERGRAALELGSGTAGSWYTLTLQGLADAGIFDAGLSRPGYELLGHVIDSGSVQSACRAFLSAHPEITDPAVVASVERLSEVLTRHPVIGPNISAG